MYNLKDAKIFLTGGHGFLGQHVYNALLEFGKKESDIYRPRSKEVDLRKLQDNLTALKGYDLVIHLAANFGGLKYNIEQITIVANTKNRAPSP